MEVEVPHDWGTTKRPTHAAATSLPGAAKKGPLSNSEEEEVSEEEEGQKEVEEEESEAQTKGEEQPLVEKKKRNKSEEATTTTVSSKDSMPPKAKQKLLDGGTKKTYTAAVGGSDSTDQHVTSKVKISKSPLGPRSVFNAITHDAPEKGQLKQMVISQLSKPCTSAEAHQREMEVHCLLSKLPYQKMLSDLFTNQARNASGGLYYALLLTPPMCC